MNLEEIDNTQSVEGVKISVWRRYIISNEVVPITRFNVIGIVLCVRPEQKVYPTQNKIYL